MLIIYDSIIMKDMMVMAILKVLKMMTYLLKLKLLDLRMPMMH